MQQEHGLAGAAHRVVDLHAVDLGPAVREPDSGMVSEVHLGELLLLFDRVFSARYNQACVAVGVKGLQLRFPQYAWIAELVDGVILLIAVGVAVNSACRRADQAGGMVWPGSAPGATNPIDTVEGDDLWICCERGSG